MIRARPRVLHDSGNHGQTSLGGAGIVMARDHRLWTVDDVVARHLRPALCRARGVRSGNRLHGDDPADHAAHEHERLR
jgi:hypothetical protein